MQAKETLDQTTGYIGKDNSGNGNIFAIEPKQLYTIPHLGRRQGWPGAAPA